LKKTRFILGLILAVAALPALLLPTPGAASGCPELQGAVIRWVVPTNPGGGYDRYSRLIEPFLEQSLDAEVVIENRSGAGGIVGSLAIQNAEADGRVMGIINASGLLAANAALKGRAPDPVQDYSILARVASNRMVVFTGRDSGISDLDALLKLSASRPVVAGVRDVGSAVFFALPITASLLGLDYSVVTGYQGSSSRVLAAIRGDIDIIVQNFDSVRSYVDSGELLPLLQISSPGTDEPKLDYPHAIPYLGGQDGIAATLAAERRASVDEAVEQASALSAIMSAGRLIVAPAGLPKALELCLQTNLMEVLVSRELNDAANKARLTIEPADAAKARSELLASLDSLSEFESLVRSAIEQTRL